MTNPGDYVIVVDAADNMDEGSLIRVRDVDGYGRLYLYGFAGPWSPKRFKEAPSYLELAEQVKTLKEKLACDTALAESRYEALQERDKQIRTLETERDQARNAILSYGNGTSFDWNVLGKIDELQGELEGCKILSNGRRRRLNKCSIQRGDLLAMCRRLLAAMKSVNGHDWTASNDFEDAYNEAETLVEQCEQST